MAGGQELATAYRMAYDASQMQQPSVRVESSRLAALPHVSAAIEWLRANRPPQDIGMMPALRDRWLVEELQQLVDSEYFPFTEEAGCHPNADAVHEDDLIRPLPDPNTS